MENIESNKNNVCKNCGIALISGEEELCFRCWLNQETKRLEQEENKKQPSSSEKTDKESPQIKPKKEKPSFLDIGCSIFAIIGIIIILLCTMDYVIDFLKNFIDTSKIIGDGNILIGIIILPLAIWGGIQMFRGFCEMCDSRKIDSALSFIFTILGYIALFYILTQL